MHMCSSILTLGTYLLLNDDGVPSPFDDPPTSLDRAVDICRQSVKDQMQSKNKYMDVEKSINAYISFRICDILSWPGTIIILSL